MNTRGIFENILDVLIFVIVTLPISLMLFFSTFCTGDEGDLGTCAISLFTPVFNAVSAFLLLAAFTGIVWIPFVFAGLIISLVIKVRRYRSGGFPKPVGKRVVECITLLPFVVVLVVLYFSYQ